MRTELQQIEEAVLYLRGELNTADRKIYEKRMAENPALAALTDEISLLERAVKRNVLRSQIESAASGGIGKWLWTMGSILLTAGVILLWMQLNPDSESLKHPASQGSEVIEETESLMPEQTNENLRAHEEEKVFSEGGREVHAPNLGGHELWAQPDIQTFHFDSRHGARIVGKQGMLMIVPPMAFTDTGQKVVSGKVEFNLVEAFDIEDMVLYKLQTLADGATLESGGMFFMEAKVNGVHVEINPERPLYIEIPVPAVQEGMMAFTGEVLDDGINWKPAHSLQKFLVHIPLDSLDFLPPGFAWEVENHMPFKSYTRATNSLVDSLYYSLSSSSEQISDRDSDVADSVNCRINPQTVETIKGSDFNESFIATHEFEERIRFLHASDQGEELLQIYIRNLDKNLWEADSLVASAALGEEKQQFRAFAAQGLTRLEDGQLYADQLSKHYLQKRTEIADHRNRLAAQYAEKSTADLNAMKADLEAFDRQNNISPSPGTEAFQGNQVYATPWLTMGWGNIDRYLKLLDGKTKTVEIRVQNRAQNTEVSQWLGAVNTYTNLAENDGVYQATFPTIRGRVKESWAFALAEDSTGFQWAFRKYNPYRTEMVELSMASATEAEIRQDLRAVGENFGRIKAERKAQKRWAEKIIQEEIKARERRENLNLQRAALLENLNEEHQRQQKELLMMRKLMAIGYPCGTIRLPEISVDSGAKVERQIFTIVEQMPQFPGGQLALQRYLASNIRYPESARKEGIQGIVFLTFVVDPDGQIADARVLRSLHPECDQMALDAIEKMPKWVPGRQRNRVVAVQYNLPVKFSQ